MAGNFAPPPGSFGSGIQYSLDLIRGLPDIMGLRPYSVNVVIHTWSGTRVGQGTKTVTTTPITLANGQRPKVRRITQKDVIPSNRLWIEGDYKIGPLTQQYTGPTGALGGIGGSVFDPNVNVGQGTEIYIQVFGPDDDPLTGGAFCKRIYYDATHPLSRIAVVRPLGIVP